MTAIWTGWSFADAERFALDVYRRGECRFEDIGKLADQIWAEILEGLKAEAEGE